MPPLKEIEKKGIVLKCILNSFPNLTGRADLKALSHLDCLEIRRGLAGLRDADIPYYLPQVLADLIQTHTGCLGKAEWADDVAFYFDILSGIDIKFSAQDEQELLNVLQGYAFERDRSFSADALYGVIQCLVSLGEESAIISGKHSLNDYISNSKSMLRDRDALFKSFSKNQKRAIWQWLALAHDWPEMVFRKQNIQSAMLYWANLYFDAKD